MLLRFTDRNDRPCWVDPFDVRSVRVKSIRRVNGETVPMSVLVCESSEEPIEVLEQDAGEQIASARLRLMER